MKTEPTSSQYLVFVSHTSSAAASVVQDASDPLAQSSLSCSRPVVVERCPVVTVFRAERFTSDV